jgi:hypothetical protein
MTTSQAHLKGPTKPQLKRLRQLAAESGGSFAWPRTAKEASEEIEELMKRKKTSRSDRRRELRDVRYDMATRRGDGASVRRSELGGYGSTAHWADDSGEDRRSEGADR